MKTKIDRKIKHSMIVDEDGLRTIQNVISKQYKHTEFTANCIDGSILETDNIEEIINFNNPDFRRITEIVFEAQNDSSNWSSSEGITLEIKSQSDGLSRIFNDASVNLDVRSKSDEKAVFVVQEIRDILKEMKPGYNLLARTSIFEVFGLIWVIYCVIITAVRFVDLIPFHTGTISLSSAVALNVTVAVVLGSFDYVRALLFPMILFHIGRQKRKLKRIIFWRKLIFGSIGLAFLISFLANKLS